MRFPQWYARWNNHVVNKAVRLWAGRLPGYGLLIHHGRTSGRRYSTPLNVFRTTDGYAVFLAYGADKTQWLKNVTAAGHAQLRHRGTTVTVSNPQVSTKLQSAAAVPPPWRWVYLRAPFAEAVVFTAQP